MQPALRFLELESMRSPNMVDATLRHLHQSINPRSDQIRSEFRILYRQPDLPRCVCPIKSRHTFQQVCHPPFQAREVGYRQWAPMTLPTTWTQIPFPAAASHSFDTSDPLRRKIHSLFPGFPMATTTTTTTTTTTRTDDSTQSTYLSSPRPMVEHVFADYDSGPSEHPASSQKDQHSPMSVPPTELRLQSLHEWTDEMETVRCQAALGNKHVLPLTVNQSITRPYDYLASQPGKDIRKQLLSACNIWLHVDKTALATIARSISMLHNASLMIDDIQDDSHLRRGQPSAHTVHGIAQTINSANHAYFLAQQELLALREASTLVNIFNEEMVNLHRGQGMDIYWRETMTTPTEDDYLKMISNKTGGLFRLAIRLMQAVSKRDVDLVPLADLLGLIFQIQDDYLNLTSLPMASAKGYCDDLEEGKFSFPVIHAIRNDPSETPWVLGVLRQKPTDETSKRQTVEYMTSVTQSMRYTKSTVERLVGQLRSQMAGLGPPNPAFEAVLAKVVA
ncbi:MAG: hypothetical protein Q9169_006937 [Polycauliona sp. 2 TL-2023]